MRPLLFLILIFISSVDAFAQHDSSAKDNILVYGDEFMFSAKEPKGWVGDIESAEKYHSNLIFYKNKEDFVKGGPIMQLLSFTKKDERTELDLQYDIKGYQDQFSELKLADLEVSHKEYRCYARSMYVERLFHQYTVYPNPGTKLKNGVSVGMNISERKATEEELKAFRSVVESLIILK